MAISYISGSTEQINGGTIINLGKNSQNNKNLLSSSANPESIGSVVIDNDHVNPADPSGIFAHNNSRPIYKLYTTSLAGISKSTSGTISINHHTKVIRSSLKSTNIRKGLFNSYTGQFTTSPENHRYYICPEGVDNCYQIPKTVPVNVSAQSDGENNLTQDGIMLRFRRLDDLFTDWNIIYVPPASIFEAEVVSVDGLSVDGETIPVVNFNEILPDGEYDIEYDTIVDSGIGILNNSQPTIKRFSGRKKITNSNVKLYKIELSGAPKLLPYDIISPNEDKNDPLYPLRFKTQETLNNFFDQTVNNTYFISVVQNNSLPGNPGQGTVGIPTALQFTAANTGLEYYENFYIDISVSTAYRSVYYLSMNISSQSNRNGTHTAFAGEINIDNPDYSVVGWMAQLFIFAANYYNDLSAQQFSILSGEDGPLKSWKMRSCELGFCDPPKPPKIPKKHQDYPGATLVCEYKCESSGESWEDIYYRYPGTDPDDPEGRRKIRVRTPPVCAKDCKYV